MNDREITQPIAEAIALTFDAPVDSILTAHLDSDGTVFGQVMSGGNFYSYVADADTIATYYHPEETEYLNEYAHAVLDNIGIHTDAWETYDYALGFFRVDAQMRCKPGNKPCGNRCISQKMKCRKGMGASAQGAMRQGRANLRSPGAGGIAAGVVGAAAIAAAGGAAYQNREAIGKAAGEVGRRAQKAGEAIGNEAWVAGKQAEKTIKGKAEELRSNVEKGVDKAKEQIQEAANKTGKEAKKAGRKAGVAVKRVQKEVEGVVANAKKGAENISKGARQQMRKSKKRNERYADPEQVQKVGARLGRRWARNMGAK